ncbi:hypothetical protein TcasGA2_TC016169 [Tribolium castaneum]|uniref:CCHC-type domain-containing protein n=1 Tax=Tribolium castaneum TaxID=7070 RepID=D7GYA0_TRICA|nr:hypothetical protein TcasGA2_TC016169 [Tribolium castaneum]
MEYSSQLMKDKIEDYQNVIEGLNRDTISSKNSPSCSYSSALKKSKSNHSSADVLILKSSDQNKNSAQIEKDIKNMCNESDLKINVNGTKHIKSGLLINCENKKSLSKLKDLVSSKGNSSYTASVPGKFNPRLKIYNVPAEDATQPGLVEDIISRNDLNASIEDIKVVAKIKNKKDYNIIIEVTPFLFKNIIERGSLYIGWHKSNIAECFNLIKCYKCCKYGHTKNKCTSQVAICPKCSGSHEMKDCETERLCCPNCTFSNSRFKLQLTTDHTANDLSCHTYQHKLNLVKQKTNYC